MKLKIILATLLASVSILAARADGGIWLWPVAGAEAGDGILYKPQTYIGQQLNFSDLFIAAPLDAEVVAPVDGRVTSISLGYLESLTSSRGGSVDFDKDFDEAAKEFAEGGGPRYKSKYVSHFIGLRTDDGRTLYIAGIKLARPFKTGETVSRGEKLGTVRYSYHAIEEPSIKISVSTPRGTVADPMSPFGIESSFIPPEELKPVTELTPQQARDDINVLVDAFIECYPSLDDLIPREELEAWRRKETEAITETIPIGNFMMTMSRACALLHDSHVAYWAETSIATAPEYWDIEMGRFGDEIRIWRATAGFEEYLNRRVTAVDGIPADSILRRTTRRVSGYDARVEDYVKFVQFARLNTMYLDDFRSADADRDCTVTFDDGSTLKAARHVWKGEKLTFKPSVADFNYINRHEGRNFDLRMLDDSTAYIGLSTFQLDEVETEQIRDFIAEQHDTPHLIFDVRNNGGGFLTNVETLVARFISADLYAGSISHKTGPGHDDFSKPYDYYFHPAPASRIKYMKPVVILTNRSSYSATNNFVSIMKFLPSVRIVGDTTGGGSGMPFTSEIPCGWTVRFSACSILDASGKETEFGVEPSEGCKVDMTDDDRARGRDTILETAFTVLTSMISEGSPV